MDRTNDPVHSQVTTCTINHIFYASKKRKKENFIKLSSINKSSSNIDKMYIDIDK